MKEKIEQLLTEFCDDIQHLCGANEEEEFEALETLKTEYADKILDLFLESLDEIKDKYKGDGLCGRREDLFPEAIFDIKRKIGGK